MHVIMEIFVSFKWLTFFSALIKKKLFSAIGLSCYIIVIQFNFLGRGMPINEGYPFFGPYGTDWFIVGWMTL